ncbi:uncharacterized protein LOC122071337 isoform X3 [Macadamia integrifolia]|uniref:uncharacterized protein LOC122071337 isoform X3 n=1 Tax=Macadamia integrifolia TaxID=60698 RepID=UPI001C4ED78F|nr:uncharacterized protein LOC122071337 isoform X3 [Macadamia integrifolia]
MNSVSNNNEEPRSWDELIDINLVPSELFLKFRKEIQGLRVGLNLEFYNVPLNECHTKLVLKPLDPDRRWKLTYEPIHHDVGISHSFKLHATGWKWKLSTCLGGDGVSRIQNKTSIGLLPGMDFRLGWKAEYVLPEIQGSRAYFYEMIMPEAIWRISLSLPNPWDGELRLLDKL